MVEVKETKKLYYGRYPYKIAYKARSQFMRKGRIAKVANGSDFRTLQEGDRISFFTDDKELYTKVLNGNPPRNIIEAFEPSTDGMELLKQGDVVLVDEEPRMAVRVHLKGRVNSDFLNWVDSNSDKVSMSTNIRFRIERGMVQRGSYMHIRDTKVLNMITLLIGSNIRKVERLVVNTHKL
mgnify:FL=1